MLQVFCDGGARGNPGPAAYGFVVYEDGSVIKSEGGYIGNTTNNVAEYSAVEQSLNWLKENRPGENLEYFLDSNLVVSQLSGSFKVKNRALLEFVRKIKRTLPNFGKISFKYIPREKNKEADKLVNQALDEKIYGITPVS